MTNQKSNSSEQIKKIGKRFDGIPRSPYALTLESTYRLIYGSPEVYFICLFKWSNLSVATILINRAKEIGLRLGKNTIIYPFEGHEDEYWKDIQDIFKSIHKKNIDIQLESTNVYLLLCACEPIELMDGHNPFILIDITNLNDIGITSFFAKILDLFNVQFDKNKKSRGLLLKSGQLILKKDIDTNNNKERIGYILSYLAEISLVLSIEFHFYCYNWNIIEQYEIIKNEICNDKEKIAKIEKIKTNLTQFKPPSNAIVITNPIIVVEPKKKKLFNIIWKIVAGIISLIGGSWALIEILRYLKVIS